jgi:dihydroorotate dehydrogenase (NAD+) catalytic subunit
MKKNVKKVSLAVNLGGIRMCNPVIAASGTFGYGEEYAAHAPLSQLGAFITKGISLQPQAGNPPPRIVETPGGMLNAIGLENVGVEALLNDKIPRLRKLGVPVMVNIFGTTREAYAKVARRLDGRSGIAGLEVNISCPNIKKGGISFGTDPREAFRVVSAVRKAYAGPLMVKLSPNVTDIAAIARSAEDAGADMISLINTLLGMAIDIDSRRPRLGNITGGLSGPAIKPVAVRMVWEVYRVVSIPVVGVGGICCSRDALEFIIAGASAVQIGTAQFINPGIAGEVVGGIADYLRARGMASLQELVGSLQTSSGGGS